MQHFLGDPDLGKLHLEMHRLTLAIAKKPFMKIDLQPPKRLFQGTTQPFKLEIVVYFKNKQPGKWDLKWRPGYRIVCIEHNGYFIHIENQATGKT